MTQHNDADAVFRSLNDAAADAGRRAAEINAENGVELHWFADWDDERGVELTVSGQNYAELIDTCRDYREMVELQRLNDAGDSTVSADSAAVKEGGDL